MENGEWKMKSLAYSSSHSSLFTLHSSLFILHSSFFILHFSFFIYMNIVGLISSATSAMRSTGSPARRACSRIASTLGASYSQ